MPPRPCGRSRPAEARAARPLAERLARVHYAQVAPKLVLAPFPRGERGRNTVLADLAREGERALLADERAALGGLREALVAAEATPDDLAMLRQAEADLDALFLLVVLGEFNAGKSAFINALLGQRALD